MIRRRLRLVAVFAAICLGTAFGSPVHAQAQEMNVLIIGTSLVRGIKKNLRDFLREDGYPRPKIVTRVEPGGSLEAHANSNRTKRALDQRPWDFVLMANTSKHMNAEDYPGARDLHDQVVARGAQPVFLMTWLPRLVSIPGWDGLRGVPGGDIGYVPIAFELGAPVAPAGWAVRQVKIDGDPVDAWKRSTHLGKTGRYLAAAVVYATITGNSPIGLEAKGKTLAPFVDYLQGLADTIVLSNPTDDWNISFD
jgi:hypothetical protein